MGALKVWNSITEAWERVALGILVRDEANTQSEANAGTLLFPNGTVFPHGDGSVSIREVPTGVVGAKVYNAATQAYTAGNTTPLTFASEEWDTDGFHDTVTNTGRFTIPASAGAGYYLVGGLVNDNGGSGTWCMLRVDGTTWVRGGGNNMPQYRQALGPVMVYLTVGQYVEWCFYDDNNQTLGHATSLDLMNTAWIAKLGSGSAAGLPSARAKRTSGNLTLNSTSWADVDNGLDLVVPAQVGDVLLVSLSADFAGGEAVTVGLDGATIVSGNPVNYISGGGGASDYGVMGWIAHAATSQIPSGTSIQYVVVAGDISGGNVTLRLRYRTGSAANRTLNATTAQPLHWSVVNLKGGVAASGIVGVAAGAPSVSIPGILVPDRVPASPSAYNDEFDTTDASDPLTGWTTLGDPSILNMNSDLASHLRIGDTATGAWAVHGIYKTSPSIPFTVTVKLADAKLTANFEQYGILLADSTPTKLLLWGHACINGVSVLRTTWNSRTSRASYTQWTGEHRARYFRAYVASATSVTVYRSTDGLIWVTYETVNPGFTVANVGIGFTGNDNNVSADAAFDWVRFT